ncbi:MAG: hypothetical protein ACK4GC_05875 [Paracoccaceae bacterium]
MSVIVKLQGASFPAAQLVLLRAYHFSPASVLAPLSHGSLVLATAAGWLVFDAAPTLATLAGIDIIVVALRMVQLGRSKPGGDG